jgi:hypothetical protein
VGLNTSALVKKSLLFAEQAADLQARTYQGTYPYLVGELVYNPTDRLLYRCIAATIGVAPDYSNPAIEGITWEWIAGSIVGYVAGRGWWQKDADGTLTQWSITLATTAPQALSSQINITWTLPIPKATGVDAVVTYEFTDNQLGNMVDLGLFLNNGPWVSYTDTTATLRCYAYRYAIGIVYWFKMKIVTRWRA